MANRFDYSEKFEAFKERTLYCFLDADQQAFVRAIAYEHRFTFQEFRQVVETVRDFALWGENGLPQWWESRRATSRLEGVPLKRYLLRELARYAAERRAEPKAYPADGLPKPRRRPSQPVITEESDKSIHGKCPVASDRTVCCNLYTIDAVENCPYGCSYCTIQTFYADSFVFDKNFAQKLQAIPIDPRRFYHFGTGQSSDSLAWGNRNGNLDALCRFAADHPNVLMEFKTKSSNVRYFLEHQVPRNIVCSWSLNTPVIIENEEHFTARLQDRIESARRVADAGVSVAFHFHPMVYYRDWEHDYPAVASLLLDRFHPQEVLFVSFGSVTFIKPVVQQIRKLGHPTKVLQMEMVPDPHGKLTYPDDVKVEMFTTMYQALRPWHGKVFMYLCMEKAEIWERTFGYVYANNEEFEAEFGRWTLGKVERTARRQQQAQVLLHG